MYGLYRIGHGPVVPDFFILYYYSRNFFTKRDFIDTENMYFQIAGIALVLRTFLLFYSLSAVLVQAIRANKRVYLKGLNTFLMRQIGSKIRTNYFIMAVECGLLTVTLCAVSVQRLQTSLWNEHPAKYYRKHFMTSVGNNDRGTLFLPDDVASNFPKDTNVLLVQYKAETDSDEFLQKMLPIGLDETHGYRYAKKNMMYDMLYGLNALVVAGIYSTVLITEAMAVVKDISKHR